MKTVKTSIDKFTNSQSPQLLFTMLTEKNSSSTSKENNEIKQKVWHQQHQFALISSYCYLIFTALSTMIGFIGVGLVLHGNITIGALTSIGSLLTTKELRKISAEANARVDRLLLPRATLREQHSSAPIACTGGVHEVSLEENRLLQDDQKNEE